MGGTGGRNKPRVIPAPWLDCDRCGWRHYPSRTQDSWRLVTVCESCGALLPQRPSDEGAVDEESLRLHDAAEALLAPQE